MCSPVEKTTSIRQILTFIETACVSLCNDTEPYWNGKEEYGREHQVSSANDIRFSIKFHSGFYRDTSRFFQMTSFITSRVKSLKHFRCMRVMILMLFRIQNVHLLNFIYVNIFDEKVTKILKMLFQGEQLALSSIQNFGGPLHVRDVLPTFIVFFDLCESFICS